MDIEAGRELDARIAEVVFGLTIVHRAWPCYTPPDGSTYEAATDGNDRSWGAVLDIVYQVREPHEDWRDQLGLWCKPVPFYSTDIAAAWLVIDALRARGMWLEELSGRYRECYRAGFSWRNPDRVLLYRQAMALTAPLAICRAALEALTP